MSWQPRYLWPTQLAALTNGAMFTCYCWRLVHRSQMIYYWPASDKAGLEALELVLDGVFLRLVLLFTFVADNLLWLIAADGSDFFSLVGADGSEFFLSITADRGNFFFCIVLPFLLGVTGKPSMLPSGLLALDLVGDDECDTDPVWCFGVLETCSKPPETLVKSVYYDQKQKVRWFTEWCNMVEHHRSLGLILLSQWL